VEVGHRACAAVDIAGCHSSCRFGCVRQAQRADAADSFYQHHIAATRAAYDLNKRLTEVQHSGISEAPINAAANKPLLDNVRLWDWRAFHDTVTQLQALRQYYVFSDTDVDRYMIDGNIRQVMLTPRELDIRQLPDARANWINSHFIYTHGYGLVMADATQITATGSRCFSPRMRLLRS
jgi:uncharacterized membrane protein (UPF0182 family)